MKFSIITPVYNGEKYITETIESVLSQEGDFEIEYIIQDGGSKDKTVEIIKKYKILLDEKKHPIKCTKVTLILHSGKDSGMYDAINKGFARATGDIYAYINADDSYLPNAFFSIAKTFTMCPKIQWIKGTSCVTKENGEVTYNTPCFIYNQEWIRKGIYGRYAPYIQQESVFWCKSLWYKIGSINTTYSVAGDYWLWSKFAHYTPLYSIKQEVSCFRRVPTSLSNIDNGIRYRAEQKIIAPPESNFLETKIKIFFWLTNKLRVLKPIWIFMYPYLFKDSKTYYVSMETRTPAMKEAKSYVA